MARSREDRLQHFLRRAVQHAHFDIVSVLLMMCGVGHWGEILQACRIFVLFRLRLHMFIQEFNHYLK